MSIDTEWLDYVKGIDAVRGREKTAKYLASCSELGFAEKCEILMRVPRAEGAKTAYERGEDAAKRLLGKR
jgi:hypothetical protein